ncbi:ATP synthase subunit h [Paraphaeosphaeria minitans]|uniref:ATP synthase subunit h n=1 Tax=Paraphaeosphaeria minitans TaxID=565426 RepID=A0A9P6GIG6_9PLEO|nr:ATP synthase subunit h [Paraphaeosphaeria minitans]
MANGWAPFIGLVVVAIFCGAAWFLSPKGEEQTYVKLARVALLVLALHGFYYGLKS